VLFLSFLSSPVSPLYNNRNDTSCVTLPISITKESSGREGEREEERETNGYNWKYKLLMVF
jgi:hypothetical protein